MGFKFHMFEGNYASTASASLQQLQLHHPYHLDHIYEILTIASFKSMIHVKLGFHIVAAVARISKYWAQQPQHLYGTNRFILLATISDPGNPAAEIAEALSHRPTVGCI